MFAVFVVLLIASHAPLLRLPYFWDEAGYYIPAARDLLAGSLIPHSTPSNAHPPLVMAWLALCWRIFDDGATVTRCAMLGLAAFSLLGFFRLARAVSNSIVAAASTFLTAIYPVFFAQSSLAQVDLAAAGFCFWGLEAYVRRRGIATAIWFSLAALAKETAILVSLALCGWEVALFVFDRERFSFVDRPLNDDKPPRTRRDTKETLGQLLVLLLPIVPLALWYGYHYACTGFVFGNPEFFRYNLQGNFHVLRIVLAFLLRIWQTIGYLNLYVLTAACILAMMYPPLPELSPAAKQEKTAGSKLRQRIPVAIQFAFVAIAIVYIVALSIVGGAVLARYMLPIVPLIILICVSTVWRRLRAWKAVLCVVAAAFIGALFVNPPYGFSPEDNLAYRDYIRLHERAEAVIVGRFPRARVLTAWPASDELSRPNLGYVARPMQVVRIEDFTAEQLLAAADEESRFDVALVFSTKYQAPLTPFDRWRRWQEWKTRYFGFHVDLGPETAASVLRGNLVYLERRKGQWVSVIEIQKIEEAKLAGPPISVSRPTYTASK